MISLVLFRVASYLVGAQETMPSLHKKLFTVYIRRKVRWDVFCLKLTLKKSTTM